MTSRLRTSLAFAACAAACSATLAAINVEGVALDESIQIAGKHLKLNGAGISYRMIFKVYAMGLYLTDRKASVQEVMRTEGPRRLVITLMRDVSGADFNEGLMNFVANEMSDKPSKPMEYVLQLGKALANQPRGLREGDTLTMDWIPGTGAVVELNRKPLTEPMRDIAFYNALLNIWLGDKPADPSLKIKLLGRDSPIRAASN